MPTGPIASLCVQCVDIYTASCVYMFGLPLCIYTVTPLVFVVAALGTLGTGENYLIFKDQTDGTISV